MLRSILIKLWHPLYNIAFHLRAHTVFLFVVFKFILICSVGNHDNHVNISHAMLLEREQSKWSEFSYTSSTPGVGGDPLHGLVNFMLPIYSSAEQKVPALLLWFLDSRDGLSSGFGRQLPNFIHPTVGRFIRDKWRHMKRYWKIVPPSLVFYHIPSQPFVKYQRKIVEPQNGHNSSQKDPDDPSFTCPGLNDDFPFEGQGTVDERYYGTDQPVLSALKESLGQTGGIFAMVSGHQHGNAWCCRDKKQQDSITACFSVSHFSYLRDAHCSHKRRVGYGGYGTWSRGSRVFEFQADQPKVIKTWNRLEGGRIIDQVELRVSK